MATPGRWDSLKGKRSRIYLLNSLIKAHGGRIQIEDLRKILSARGYPHLHEKLEAMGFDVAGGHVQGHVHG